MKGDFSRKTFDASKHYGGVLMQQGRVQLDADWNEQLAIQRHRDETEARDVIGDCGAPKHEAGFLVEPTRDGKDLLIWPGRFYVHGRMCELESTPVEALFKSSTEVIVSLWHVDGADFAPGQYVEISASTVSPEVARIDKADQPTLTLTLTLTEKINGGFETATGLKVRRLTTYLTQPDLPDPPYIQFDVLPHGAYLVYLDVWPRHLTAVDDDLIREKALGGPDTATRVKTVWQVKLWPGADDEVHLPDDTACGSPVAGWEALTAPSTGRLNARTQPAQDTDNPCILPPGAGYVGLENQLYRVEIHKGGVLGKDEVTFKWSRDNGSVVKSIVKIPNSENFTVHDTGPDEVLGLFNGKWVEQIDDAIDLNGIAGDLFQFQMDPITGAVPLSPKYEVNEGRHPQLRRWDSNGKVSVPVGGGWVELENGIQVRFEDGTYRTGDYWVIPARTVLGDIEWPLDGAGHPVPQLRRGIRHEYCRIGVLKVGDSELQVEDCRPLFPPLSELKSTSSCCTFTVGDGVTHVGDFTLIQEAVDHLPKEGGQICIFPGTYVENVVIDGRRNSNVHIKGCGHRTKVSSPPNDKGVPVFQLVATAGVKIESLAIEAAEDSPGILADDESPNRSPNSGIVIEQVELTAAKESAIKICGAEDVTIKRSRVKMTEGNGGCPGIFLQATDALVRDNVVTGTLLDMGDRETRALNGARAVSALQLGGGCQRIRIHDNLFQGCSGQGITLGSMIEVGPDEQTTPRRVRRWVADASDPCLDCDDVTTGDREPREGPEEESPTLLESDGDLYDIDIRRNRIFDMGLDGIGVAHFFNLVRARTHRGLVRLEDLAIVDNRIQRCVRRKFARIDRSMIDLMAYGGISLSMVEGLVVRDNRIEDIGVGGILPVCGIFVLYGEGVEIGRNHILNSGLIPRPRNARIMSGRCGGIHVVFAVAPTALPSKMASLFKSGGAAFSSELQLAQVAAVVENNTVDVIRGQALSLGALGAVSVLSNRFISRGLAPPSDQATEAPVVANPLSNLASLVAIVGPLGSGFVRTDRIVERSGRIKVDVLFNDNQCLLDLARERQAQHTSGRNYLFPAIVILSGDDVGVQDNQCECIIKLLGYYMPAALILRAESLRVVSNRFKETPGSALYSALTVGEWNMTTHNQATHCLAIRDDLGEVNPLKVVDQPNQVLHSTDCKGGTFGKLVGALESLFPDLA